MIKSTSGSKKMAIQNSEVTTENVLSVLVKMPQGDFERVVDQAKEQRKKRRNGKKVSPVEADLLHKINNIFPTDQRRRYNELYPKFKNDKLNEKERTELEELVDKFENLNAKRLGYIGELANLRGETLEQVMDTFEITN
jgi:hypothetical protein